jgi:hypothetical protein
MNRETSLASSILKYMLISLTQAEAIDLNTID